MIGDLTSAPEPIQIKLFSPDAALLANWAPKVADAIKKMQRRGGCAERHRQHHQRPGSDLPGRSRVAARAGFTAEEVALGCLARSWRANPRPPRWSPTTAPTPFACAFPPTTALRSMPCSNTLLTSSTGKTATLGRWPPLTRTSRTNRNPARESAARCRGHRAPGRHRSWAAASPRCRRRWRAAHSVRASAWNMAAPTRSSSRSFHDLLDRAGAGGRCWCSSFCCLSSAPSPRRWRFSPRRLLSTSGVFIALLITRTTFNVSSFMGMIMVVGIVAKNGILLLDADQKFRAARLVRGRRDAAGQPAPAAPDRHDRPGHRRRHAAAGVCAWAPVRRCCNRSPSP